MRPLRAILVLAAATLAGPSWRSLPADGAPKTRLGATSVWTGHEMILWGGYNETRPDGPVKDFVATGARFDPASGKWRPLPLKGAPSARAWHSAVWTGREMLVWGGQEADREFRDGAAFDPEKNAWRPLSPEGAPRGRVEHCAVWTGSEMIVWGGVTEERSFTDGGRYDPAADSWKPVPSPEFLDLGRRAHGAAWTGREMVVWGGINGGSVLGTGLAFDPATSRWRPVSSKGAPTARGYPGTAWTGDRLVVWGGQRGVLDAPPAGRGALYDPETDRWESMPVEGAPSPRWHHAVAWTGEAFLVWGGRARLAAGRYPALGDGASWKPGEATWRPLPAEGAPSPRYEPCAAWTGECWLIWGGGSEGGARGDGGVLRFEPREEAR